MKLHMSLFFIFCKIGLFTLGGGYAMLPLIEAEITERRKWISKKDFVDLTALAQAAPGILAVNMAVFTGYKLGGVAGAVAAALGAVLPSFGIILLIALFFHNFRTNPTVARIFQGIRPAVVALIVVPVWRLGKSAGITRKTVWVAAAAALAVWIVRVSPIYMVLIAGAGGWLWGREKKA